MSTRPSGLEPELAAAVDSLAGSFDPGVQLRDMNVVRMLRSTPDLLGATGGMLPADPRVAVSERLLLVDAGGDQVPLRIYEPLPRPAGLLPGVVFFHGGAFVIGDVYTEELRCLRYAAEAQCVVVSVGYRLAPENPYPAAADDCYSALQWTVERAHELGVDSGRLAVAGSSAGGALAASTALRARDLGGPPIVFQLLVYPVLDDRMETESMKAFDTTALWTNDSNKAMWDHYLGVGEKRHAVSHYAAPARAGDLSRLPSAYVLTAELDPLRDEGIDYARRLMLAGVPTELHNFARTCHGFDLIGPATTSGRSALNDQVRALSSAFACTEEVTGARDLPGADAGERRR